MTHFEEYNKIIDFRKANPLPKEQYGENHHIVPKSICPILKNSRDNIVRLTAQEHFMAHYHLWLAYRDELKDEVWAKKMCWGFHAMKRQLSKCDDIETLSKLYEEVKIEFSKNQTGEKNHQYGKHPKRTPEQRKRMSDCKLGAKNPMFGKPQSEETRRKRSQSLMGHPGYWTGKTQSREVIEKIAAKNRGKKRSLETRQKMSASLKGKRWFTNGKVNAYTCKCPDGFRPGMTRKSKKGSN